MHESVRNYWIAFNDPLEGRVHFMYLDQKGWLSTGIGNKIDETVKANSAPSPAERSASLALAGQLRWLDGNDSEATPDQVATDWDAVKARLDLAPKGHLAFQPLTALHVQNEEIDRHVFAKLDEMESVLTGRPEFRDFATWPANAQLAVLSMSWGLGPAFKFPRFQEHVAARDWNGAAPESHFTPDEGTIKIRNNLDREHLLIAQIVEDQGLPKEQIAMKISDVFGVQGALLALGCKPGPQDGADGPSTQSAVREFQRNSSLDPNGSFEDEAMLGALRSELTNRGFTVVGG
ncbi:peptidoglycan-binding protein [Micromonospora sp. NBC_01412]|uniref:peptidoglycan-binding protein n=1 Tax=Micromonospora sp. NBC_01412 TaxID=2903590 RepID=UPI0032473536